MSAALFSMMPDASPQPATGPSLIGQAAAFAFIGGAGAAGFVLLSTIAAAVTGAPSSGLNALCYAAMIVPVYLAHRRFSFQSELPHSHALPRYVGVQVMAMALVTLFSYIVYSRLGLTSVLGTVLVIGLTSGLNFVVLRFWAFAQRTPLSLLALRPLAQD